MKDLVTTFTPVYNCEKYIKKCIESLLSQTYKNLEIICIDDCSTDSTWNVLSQLFHDVQDERLILVKLNKNVGRYKADNFALSFSSGKYICINDADDFSLKNRIEKSLRFIKKTKADIIGGRINVFDDAGKILKNKELKKRRHYYWAFQPPYNVNQYLKDNPYRHYLYNTTMFLSRNVFDTLGGFDNTRIGGDTEFIARSSFLYKIRNSHEIYTNKTLRSDSLTEDPITNINSPQRRKYKLYRDMQQKKRVQYYKQYGHIKKSLIYKQISLLDIGVSEILSISQSIDIKPFFKTLTK